MAEDFRFKKTRFAPTPSGYLHLGNVLSFAITASLAKKTGARILLRIDDMDHERTNKLYVQDIFDTLNFLEIPWDEGPKTLTEFDKEFSQVHRMYMYREALQKLKEQTNLFACSCSRSQLARNHPLLTYTGTCRNKDIPLESAQVSWRVFTPEPREMSVKTLNGTAPVMFPENMKDFIVRKKDGFPAYQLTSVMDDLYYGVDLVVRGDDLWPSSLAQLYLATLLGKSEFQKTTFYHHTLLTGDDGNKLSKSEGATSVQYLRKQHKKPADIYALISTMLHMEQPVKNLDEFASQLGTSI